MYSEEREGRTGLKGAPFMKGERGDERYVLKVKEKRERESGT